jgi:GDP/UDP-N,N'-diacetylbacillosamine 2-epimerase (hydrolysing)
MEIAILTSSRADFGFYKPLLNLLDTQNEIKYKLVVFGTHLSLNHGYTVNDIEASGYKAHFKVDAVPVGDRSVDIAECIGLTHLKFAQFWNTSRCSLILCIGDRYEMFAAVSASVPFNIPIAHISGGEETLGAIDNIYRHSLTLMSKYHFTNTENNAKRVAEIIGSQQNVYHTGSLAIDNINETKLYTSEEFGGLFNFNLELPYILFTFHPETVNHEANELYAKIIESVLVDSEYSILVTMPNADTMGSVIRSSLYDAAEKNKNITLVESLGSKGYYTALKQCFLVLGNSSSGLIEAASFGKYVINLGNRQLGREAGKNVIHCKIDKLEVLQAINSVKELPELGSENIYGDGNASTKIFNILRAIPQRH